MCVCKLYLIDVLADRLVYERKYFNNNKIYCADREAVHTICVVTCLLFICHALIAGNRTASKSEREMENWRRYLALDDKRTYTETED